MRLAHRLAGRLHTVWALLAYFATRGRFFFLPLVLMLLLAGVLLMLTGGLSYIAPFAYTLF